MNAHHSGYDAVDQAAALVLYGPHVSVGVRPYGGVRATHAEDGVAAVTEAASDPQVLPLLRCRCHEFEGLLMSRDRQAVRFEGLDEERGRPRVDRDLRDLLALGDFVDLLPDRLP